ncbi:MAG TPA: carbamoyltransferase C-terminal domain-containing protein [Chloroflexota bacterium]|jgi:carbamoyltransferase
MDILGINAYHGGASACLIRDGELIAAAEEERFRRIKYWAGFPSEAIKYCLAEGGITAYDLDHVGISRNPNANLHKKVLFALRRRPSFNLVRDRLANAAKVRDPKVALIEALGLDAASLKAQFHHVEHHRAHLASAFFVSPFPEAAVVSVDGMGDFVSTMWGVGRDTQLDVDGAINFPHSLGIYYTAVCQWLGFTKYGDEGKVMGLAPYGQPRYLDEMRKIVRLQRDGTFELDLDMFVHHAGGATMTWDDGEPELGEAYSPEFVKRFGEPRDPRVPIEAYEDTRYVDVAASLQVMLEEAEFHLLRKIAERTGQRALCLAGGVALNSVFNGKVLPNLPFDDIYIQPAAGDAGTAVGVAYYIYHQGLGQPRKFVMERAGTGPAYADDALAEALACYNLSAEVLDEAALCEEAARLIAAGNVVGWFQGRMEWGPRALGQRSILADPRRDDMKDILNARIKHRERFRPFAPSVLLEATGDYFDQDYPDPFMLKVYNVRPEKQALIPAVTHVDGTGRLQTVDRATAPLYWQLIKAFEGQTGVPVVLNTSFNENEPIVCRPEEAIECFLRTRMDALALGNRLVVKR